MSSVFNFFDDESNGAEIPIIIQVQLCASLPEPQKIKLGKRDIYVPMSLLE